MSDSRKLALHFNQVFQESGHSSFPWLLHHFPPKQDALWAQDKCCHTPEHSYAWNEERAVTDKKKKKSTMGLHLKNQTESSSVQTLGEGSILGLHLGRV